jgi:hypothetical protein
MLRNEGRPSIAKDGKLRATFLQTTRSEYNKKTLATNTDRVIQNMVKRVVQEAPKEYVIEHLVTYDFYEDTVRSMVEEICRQSLISRA